MADEEKDELHHSGIEIEEGYTPRTERKPVSTMIDKKISNPEPFVEKTPEPEPEKEKPPLNIPEELVKEGVIKIPEIKFDPYREPIE
ncbi:MAG: hypothetical protein R3B55_00880 [Candidatus Paceibacterota bacterium]